MKLSIVLAAYNGAETICAQLESILAQTRKPDEVLIFDDCSTDDTVETVRRFAAQYDPDGAIRLIQNEKNQGWRANFMQGFRQAAGDVIFCADQDDVWHKDKLEKMTAVLEQHPEVRVLACNIHPFYEEGAQLVQVGSHQTDPYGTHPLEKVALDKMWLEPWRPGCAMCFRRELLPQLEAIWFPACAHDLLLWAVGIAVGGAWILNEELIDQRRHSGNNTPSNAKTRKIRGGLMELYTTLSGKILQNQQRLTLPLENVQMVEQLNRFYTKRGAAIRSGNPLQLTGLLADLKLYPTGKAWLADCLAALR